MHTPSTMVRIVPSVQNSYVQVNAGKSKSKIEIEIEGSNSLFTLYWNSLASCGVLH